MANLTTTFDQIASQAWQRSKTFLERMYDCWVGEGWWEPSPPKQTFRIWEQYHDGPVACHLCGDTEQWTLENDRHNKVFVCEHEPIVVGHGAIRQVSSVPMARVVAFVETSRPPE